MVNEVDDQALDVRPIMVLIRHDHDWSVPQVRDVCINSSHVKTHDFYQILKLLVLQDLRRARVTNVHNLPF